MLTEQTTFFWQYIFTNRHAHTHLFSARPKADWGGSNMLCFAVFTKYIIYPAASWLLLFLSLSKQEQGGRNPSGISWFGYNVCKAPMFFFAYGPLKAWIETNGSAALLQHTFWKSVTCQPRFHQVKASSSFSTETRNLRCQGHRRPWRSCRISCIQDH